MRNKIYQCNHCPFREPYGKLYRRRDHTWKQCRGMLKKLKPSAPLPTTGCETFIKDGPTFSIVIGSGPASGPQSNEASPTPNKKDWCLTNVLKAYGCDLALLGDLDIALANKLPNMRHSVPDPQRYHTPWQILDENALNVMPSLERLLVELIRAKPESGMLRDAKVIDEKQLDNAQLTRAWWDNWASKVFMKQKETSKAMDLLLGPVFPMETQRFSTAADDFMRRHLPGFETHEFRQWDPQAHCTPRGAMSTVHYDDDFNVATTFGWSDAPRDSPLKLWLFWPSTEQRHLSGCFGKTNKALKTMDHGSFFVQMPGETVIVPPNSPHAVITLDSCYLHGHGFKTETLPYDPASTVLDFFLNVKKDIASQRVCQLNLGLKSETWRKAHIEQFIETWPADSPIVTLPGHQTEYDQLIQTWADDIQRTGSCAWCAEIGLEPQGSLRIEDREHARAHLEGREPGQSYDKPLPKQKRRGKATARVNKSLQTKGSGRNADVAANNTSQKRGEKRKADTDTNATSQTRGSRQAPIQADLVTRTRKTKRRAGSEMVGFNVDSWTTGQTKLHSTGATGRADGLRQA